MKKFFAKYKKLICMLAFTIFFLFIWRIGTHITLPFIDTSGATADTSNIFGFLDVFTGGALSQLSILALGISPYITASIVIQLLQMDIVPIFKEWSEEGESGKAKLNQWTRYLGLFLAFVQGLALIIGIYSSYGLQFFEETPNAFTYIYMALVITAGTAAAMWLADQITMHGIGNGSSMLITAGIVAGFPSMFTTLANTYLVSGSDSYLSDNSVVSNVLTFIFIALLFILIIVGVIFMEGIQRKIPVQYANRPAAAKIRGRQDSNVPLKLNSASVIPVIFASTLLSLPLTIVNFVTSSSTSTSVNWWELIFSYNKPIGFVLYIILIFVFAFFYSFLQINPQKMSENLKKNNAFIPQVKPGDETANFISKVLFKVTLLGATYLAILAALPIVIGSVFNLGTSVQIGGTGLMIVVGVAIETAKQIKTTTEAQEYRGFM